MDFVSGECGVVAEVMDDSEFARGGRCWNGCLVEGHYEVAFASFVFLVMGAMSYEQAWLAIKQEKWRSARAISSRIYPRLEER